MNSKEVLKDMYDRLKKSYEQAEAEATEKKVKAERKAIDANIKRSAAEDWGFTVVQTDQMTEVLVDKIIKSLEADGFKVDRSPVGVSITVSWHPGPNRIGETKETFKSFENELKQKSII